MRWFQKAARRMKHVQTCCWSFFQLGPLRSPLCLDSLKHRLMETWTWINTWSCLLRQKSNSRWEPATVTVEGLLLLYPVNLKRHKKSESTGGGGGWTACFERSCHHVFVWHWSSHTKKPSASQQRRFELHTCLRSYSQLTLTQPRHQKKGKSSSHPARQEGRRADRQEGSLFWNLAYLLYLAFFIFSSPSVFSSCFLYYIFSAPSFLLSTSVPSAPSPPLYLSVSVWHLIAATPELLRAF